MLLLNRVRTDNKHKYKHKHNKNILFDQMIMIIDRNIICNKDTIRIIIRGQNRRRNPLKHGWRGLKYGRS